MAALLFASEASAQMYRPESFEAAPSLALGLAPAGIHAFNTELDVFAFEVFGGGRRLDRLSVSNGIDRAGPWTMYGRVYVFNFQNQLTDEPGVRLGLSRTGPNPGGGARIYIGIRKRFD
jgi:hypothetical protein